MILKHTNLQKWIFHFNCVQSSGNFIHFSELSRQPPPCENYQSVITCEGNVSTFSCPDSMCIYLIDGFYGRKNGNVWV